MRLNDDAKTVTAMDVLVPGIGEVIGGAQREERLEQLWRTCSSTNSSRRITGGTWICAAMALCRTPASGWGLSDC